MKGYDPWMTFDESNAALYDRLVLRGDEEAAVAFLSTLADGGPALELAIGTGRIALPLAATGVRVDGIDFSEPMVAQLRAKPGGDEVDVTIGDFADVAVSGAYRLIYVVFNSFFNLLTQEDQVRASRTSRPISPMTATSSSKEAARSTSCSTCVRGSTSTLKASGSTPCASTSCASTRRRRCFPRTMCRSRPRASRSIRSCSATPGRPSSTSWLVSPGCGSGSAGAAGRESPSAGRASSTSRSGAADPAGCQAIGRS